MRLDHLLSKENMIYGKYIILLRSEQIKYLLGRPDFRCLIFEVRREDGGIAQLGEHLLCKQGVSGSIPLISTRIREKGQGPKA